MVISERRSTITHLKSVVLHRRVVSGFSALIVFLTAAGCSTDVSNREPYKNVVGRTVRLKMPMAIWLPNKDQIIYRAYPYFLVRSDWKPYMVGPYNQHIPNGKIITILPAGSSLNIEKVRHFNGLDDVHDDALGSVKNPMNGEALKFDYMYGFYGHHEAPWD